MNEEEEGEKLPRVHLAYNVEGRREGVLQSQDNRPVSRATDVTGQVLAAVIGVEQRCAANSDADMERSSIRSSAGFNEREGGRPRYLKHARSLFKDLFDNYTQLVSRTGSGCRNYSCFYASRAEKWDMPLSSSKT